MSEPGADLEQAFIRPGYWMIEGYDVHRLPKGGWEVSFSGIARPNLHARTLGLVRLAIRKSKFKSMDNQEDEPMTGTEKPEATKLSPQERLRLWRLAGRMPFAAGLRTGKDEFKDVNDVAEFLEALVGRLEEHSTHAKAQEEELLKHQRLMRNGRELFAYFSGANGTKPDRSE